MANVYWGARPTGILVSTQIPALAGFSVAVV